MYFKKLELLGFKSFADKTTLHFEPGITAVVGPNGCGKCLEYNSLVTLANGANVKIGDLVEAALEKAPSKTLLDDGSMALSDDNNNASILSLNLQTFKIESRPVYAFIKRTAPDYLLEIKTKSGKIITTTHYHPFFSVKDGQIIDLQAQDLKVGVRVAVPRSLPVTQSNARLDLFTILKRFKTEDHVYVPYSQELGNFLLQLKSTYATYAAMSGSLKVNQLAVSSAISGQAININNFIKILENSSISEIPEFVKLLKSHSCGEMALPREINNSIARFLGYIISEGRTTKANQVWFVNEDKDVIGDFINCAYESFGVRAKEFSYKDKTKDVLIFSNVLCEFLEKVFDFKIEDLSKDKQVPALIFNCDNKIIAEFLTALFEGDGYLSVGREGSGNYFEYASASKALAYGVSSLLLRLGVQSVVRENIKSATNTKRQVKRTYYSVFIYGLENIKKLSNLLNFTGKKSKKNEIIKNLNYTTNLNLDLIPEVNGILKDLIKLSGIKVKKFRKISPKLAAYYENRCNPSRTGLLEVLSIIAEHGKITGLAQAIYNYLKLLANSDIYWDEITDIKKIYSHKWVYDLSVQGNHNFVAQNIIVHNSNVFDSIRWVLGEQSVKSLRGSKMEDVIFNGTESKPPLGFAEVSLTFSNESKRLPIEYDEVTVTRRLFRSGESEYLINKNIVRLKDIAELFMGTGIGAESYSLIEQGKIDLILSSRPEDRRLVFDEASGISKYKSQKRETFRRLEDTQANLLRINDIVTEVKRQINSLERQAAKARRYKEVFDKLKVLESRASRFQIKQIDDELEKLNIELSRLSEEEVQKANLISELSNQFTDKEHEIIQTESSLNKLKSNLNDTDNLILRNTQQLSFSRERINELETRINLISKQKEELEVKIREDEDRINNFKYTLATLTQELNGKKSLKSGYDSELAQIAASLSATQDNIKNAKLKVLEFATTEATLNNQIQTLNQHLHQTIARKKRLDLEKFKAEEELNQTREKLTQAVLLRNELLEKFTNEKKKNDELKVTLDSTEKEKEKLKEHLLSLENEKLGLESQKEFLNHLKLRYENISESSDATLFLDNLTDKNISGIIIRVANVENPDETGLKAMPQAKFKVTGIAKPISLNPEEIIGKIESLGTAIDKEKAALEEKTRLLDLLSQEVVRSDAALRSADIEYNNQNTQTVNIEQYSKKIEEESELVLSEYKETDEQLEQLKIEEATFSEKLKIIKDESAANQKAIETCLEEMASNNTLKENILIAVGNLNSEISTFEEKLSSANETYAIYEESYLKSKTGLQNILEEGAASKNRILTLENDVERLTKECENSKIEKERLEKEISVLVEALTGVRQAAKDLKSKIDEYKNNLNDEKAKIHELKMRDQELNFSKNNILERCLQVYKIVPEELNAIAWEIDPTQTDPQAPIKEFSIEEITAEIEQLKVKLESYGQVNLVAIEEFEELKTRHDFLNNQAEDLIKSKEALHEAILKINRTTKKMFMDTFEKLQVEFKNYFRLLFGGGDAQLFLLDEQDILESGIEIACRPPGKKLQNVLLLSGGEKAMSAIALLFAIFKVKPSPFCVLDEIDAPLDEANVDRFSRTLVEFTSQSQFIVITHNKKTIANANIMYGITMEKAGISKIVSVKLAENNVKKQAEQAPAVEATQDKEEPPQNLPATEEAVESTVN